MSLAAERRRIGRIHAANVLSAKAEAQPAPVRPLSLRLNFSWVLAGNLVRAACRYGMLLLLAHFCGLAAAGKYALAVALCTPIWALVMLGLRGAQVTDSRNEYTLADYLAVRAAASGIGLIVVAGVVLFSGYDTQASAVIALVALAKLIEGISDIFWGRLQQRERMDRMSMALVVQGASELALVSIVGSLGGSIVLVVACFPVAMGLTLVCWDLPCYFRSVRMDGDGFDSGARFWQQPIRWTVLARLSIISLPLAVVAFLIALTPQLPKYVISDLMGDEAVAVYTLITYWITLGMMVVAALGNAATPRLAKYHAAGETQAFARLLIRLVALVGGMGIAGAALVAFLGPRIAAGLGHEYSDLPQLAAALSVFAAMLYVTGPLGRALTAMRAFWSQTFALAAGIVVALAVLPWAVQSRGLTGAAEAMAFSMGVVALLSAVLVWRDLIGHGNPAPASSKEAVRQAVS